MDDMNKDDQNVTGMPATGEEVELDADGNPVKKEPMPVGEVETDDMPLETGETDNMDDME